VNCQPWALNRFALISFPFWIWRAARFYSPAPPPRLFKLNFRFFPVWSAPTAARCAAVARCPVEAGIIALTQSPSDGDHVINTARIEFNPANLEPANREVATYARNRILIVEDDTDVREIFSRALRHAGMKFRKPITRWAQCAPWCAPGRTWS